MRSSLPGPRQTRFLCICRVPVSAFAVRRKSTDLLVSRHFRQCSAGFPSASTSQRIAKQQVRRQVVLIRQLYNQLRHEPGIDLMSPITVERAERFSDAYSANSFGTPSSLVSPVRPDPTRLYGTYLDSERSGFLGNSRRDTASCRDAQLVRQRKIPGRSLRFAAFS